jgi:hypothetical protein
VKTRPGYLRLKNAAFGGLRYRTPRRLLVPDTHEIEDDQDGKRRAEQPEKNQKH